MRQATIEVKKRAAIWQLAELIIVLHCLLAISSHVDLLSDPTDKSLDLMALKASPAVFVLLIHFVSHLIPNIPRH